MCEHYVKYIFASMFDVYNIYVRVKSKTMGSQTKTLFDDRSSLFGYLADDWVDLTWLDSTSL